MCTLCYFYYYRNNTWKGIGLGKCQVLQKYSIHYLHIFWHITNFKLAYQSHWGVLSITLQVKTGLPATQVW